MTKRTRLSDLTRQKLSSALFSGAAREAEIVGASDEAKECLREATRLYTEDALVLNDYAWLLLTARKKEAQDPKEALEAARMAVKLTNEKNGVCLDTLALALFRTGDIEGAVENQTKAVASGQREEVSQERLREYQDALARMRSGAPGKP